VSISIGTGAGTNIQIGAHECAYMYIYLSYIITTARIYKIWGTGGPAHLNIYIYIYIYIYTFIGGGCRPINTEVLNHLTSRQNFIMCCMGVNTGI